jgi:hypothetical protein
LSTKKIRASKATRATRATRATLAVAAIGAGLAMLWFALMLAGLGMFCFDGALFSPSRAQAALAPDCFVIGVAAWVNPKVWLLGNLLWAIVLSLWALASAVGLLWNRSWSTTVALTGTVIGVAYFLQLAVALSQFRTVSSFSVAAVALFAFGCIFLRSQSGVGES